MTRWTALLRDRAGVASLEAALITSLVLVPLLGGAADAGLLLDAWGNVTRAEQAALLSAWGSGASPATIQAAAKTAYGSASPAPTIPLPTVACYCLPSATAYSRGNASAVSCSTTCASGNTLTQFATVSVGTTVTLPLPMKLIGFASPFPITASATARLQ
jgi:Flp pilus assembly protein TadG